MSVRIESLHGLATVQGAPRYGLQKFGVPSGGAFDLESLRQANVSCGNEPGLCALELALAKLVLRAESDVLISVAGATCAVSHDGAPCRPGNPVWMQPGARLSLEVPMHGVLTYIAIRGGLVRENACTTRLTEGCVLEIGPASGSEPTVVQRCPDTSSLKIQVELGPQAEMFHVPAFFGQRFEVTRSINRHGVRLQGFAMTGGKELVSEPCCPGAVQVTASGQLIVIGPDGPTIGGYPKIAVVTRASLNVLAQRRPGQKVQFEMAR